MSSHPNTALLAAETAARRAGGDEPPVLFLGAGCARSAGAPSIAAIARNVFSQLEARDIDVPLPPAGAGDSELAAAFRRLLLTLPRIQRAGLSLQASATVPVPQFLQDLAVLVRAGTFGALVTTAFDALLERALAGSGMRPERDFAVLDVGDQESEAGDVPPGAIRVLKLYGDREACSGTALGELLAAPLVVVGHQADDPPLADKAAVAGGPVWWVEPSPAGSPDLQALDRVRDVHRVDGPAGDPDRFFAELAVMLIQLPAINLSARPEEALQKAQAEGLVDPGKASERIVVDAGSFSGVLAQIGGTEPPADEEEFERQLLQGRLRRCEDVLHRLERRAAGGAVDEALRRQLEYQRREAAALASQLQVLEGTRMKVLDMLEGLTVKAKAHGDPKTVGYLNELVGRIGAEYSSPAPNENVLFASLGAVKVLADRLGGSPELMHQLSTLTPAQKTSAW
ncbi:MAG TPA: hypothetical protein VF529_08555 [Solirubrobacteraceae bacterium]